MWEGNSETQASTTKKTIQSRLFGEKKGGFSLSETSSEAEQKLTQARWCIYCRHVVSKQTFADEYFREMLCAQNKNATAINKDELIHWVEAEFDLFCGFLCEALSCAGVELLGNRNRHAQGQ
jgi:hypothetical protein